MLFKHFMRELLSKFCIRLVQHQPNTSDEQVPQGCVSWIEYWKQHTEEDIISNSETYWCPSCGNDVEINDVVGAHVIDMDNTSYICPTCQDCNKKYQSTNAIENHFWVRQKLLVLNPHNR